MRLSVYPEPVGGLLIDSEEAFKPNRGNAAIPFGGILSVRVNPGRTHHAPVRIRTRKRRWRFTLLEFTKQEELEKFFDGLPLTVLENGLKSYEHQPAPTAEQVRRFVPYRNISIALSALGVVSAALWLTLDGASKPLATLNLLLLAAAFALYCASFAAIQPMKPAKRMLVAPLGWIFPAVALFFRAMYDYRIDDGWKIATPAAAIALFFAAILLVCLRKKKPELNRVLAALLCIAIFSCFAAIHLNCLLDDGSRTTIQQWSVEFKGVYRKINGPTDFGLVLRRGEAYRSMNAPRSLYDRVEKGGKVNLVTSTGALGIPYTFVEAVPQNGTKPDQAQNP